MKKLAVYLMTLMMFVGLATPVNAEDEFVPSITYKPSPEVVAVATSDDGLEILGEIVDETGKVLSVVHRGCVRVNSLEEALDEESDIADSVRELLIKVYNEFLNNEINLSEECEGLNEVVAEALGEGNTAENLVIRDLFDIQVHHEECNNWLEQEGTTLDLVLDVDIEKGTFVQVIRYKDGKWEMVEEVVNNNENNDPEDDGTITVTSERYCPVAILVPGTLVAVDAPAESPFNFIWIIIAIILAIIGWFIRKKSKKA